MVKVYPGELTAIDLIEVQGTPGARTAVTPFGAYPKRYLGTSVRWKGTNCECASDMSVEEIARRLGISEKPGGYGRIKGHGVATGLKKIATVARRIKDVYGVGAGTISGKKTRRIRTKEGVKEYTVEYSKTLIAPLRCFRIAREHGKDVPEPKTAATVVQLVGAKVPVPYRLVPIVV